MQSNPLEIKRIALLNRGEAAMRFLRALREYNIERRTQIEVVALFTEPDQEAPFVRLADQAVPLGVPLVSDGAGGMKSAYCEHDRILGILREAGCDAVWPGWGFLSEDAAFVARLEQEGIVFLGPSSEAMVRLGDKIEAKYLAESCGVPLAPWGLIEEGQDEAAYRVMAERVGFPLMVKASAGGGGRGIRRVERLEDLVAAVQGVQQEAARSFGAGGVFMEACIQGARHVEVQLVADAAGDVTALGVRDCSIQRRHQKVIEEAPSPILPPEIEQLLCDSSCRLAKMAGYQGVGTAEFLYEPATRKAAFLEVNSRLQVEHTVTELIAGCDLVKAQIDIARGIAWERPSGDLRGHAIEVRLNAEDPERGFMPSPGRVRLFQPPAGPGVRVDSGIREGMTIPSAFDSMIAKVMAWGQTREQARARLLRALAEMQIVVEDGATNKAFLLGLLQHPQVVESSADTGWLDRVMASGGSIVTPAHALEALIVAAIIESKVQEHAQEQLFFAQVQNGIPQKLPEPRGRSLGLRLRGSSYTLDVFALGQGRYLVGMSQDALWSVSMEETGPHTSILHIEDRSHDVLYASGRSGMMVEVDGHMHAIERLQSGTVKAPSPALVVHVAVEEGQVVRVGDLLCILEAMKMEMPVYAQEAGVVRSILCRANQQVHAGQSLLVVEPSQEETEDTNMGMSGVEMIAAPKQRWSVLFNEEGIPQPIYLDKLGDEEAREVMGSFVQLLEAMMLGFDVPPLFVKQAERLLRDDVDFAGLQRPERWLPLLRLLGAFAESESLFDRNLLPVAHEAAALSAELDFYDFCRRHHEGSQGAQEAFRPLLQRALRWYGVVQLDPSEALREALWRLAIGHTHNALRHRLCSLLLRLAMDLYAAGAQLEEGAEEFRGTLEQVARVASDRYAFVADNARQASYVLFERSQYVQRRQEIQARVETMLEHLRSYEPGSAEFEEASRELLASRYSLFPSLLQRISSQDTLVRRLIPTLLGRLYIEQRIEVQAFWQKDDIALARVDIAPHHERSQLGVIVCSPASLKDALRTWKEEQASLSSVPLNMVEVLVTGRVTCADFGQEVEASLREASLESTGVLQWSLSWCNGHDGVSHRSYRLHEEGLLEDPLLCDIHPEAASRLELWRLQEFSLERLEAPEKIYAFRATAKANPQDVRIFVLGEVRSVPPELPNDPHDEHLWEFEQIYFEALRVIREIQSRQDVRKRLLWNRILLYVRPVVRFSARDLARLSHRFEASTRGLGIEKVVIRTRWADMDGEARTRVFVIHKPGRHRLEVKEYPPSWLPIRAMKPYEIKVVRARRLGYVYPYEIIRMLQGETATASAPHPEMKNGRFVEYDLDASQERLFPVHRPYGENRSGVIVGVMSHETSRYPEGMRRVWIASDPTMAMGALAESECRRVLAALDLAEDLGIPVEWLPISAGARIAMDSGTENLDWTARVLRRIVHFTQAGGHIHVIVAGVNVGAQSYWNAEATMLMHTRGILIMMPESSMVLTGKKALEYSGGVAAEDERGIGGFERIMGPNGQAQYFASDLGEAYALLFSFYRYGYRSRGDAQIRRFETQDPEHRSIMDVPYQGNAGDGFATVGEIFHEQTNPGRKKPFAIRAVMSSVIDQDGGFLERFRNMRHADTAVVWDAFVGGFPTCVIGFESRPLPRRGRIPLDGPDTWTGGTLFPQSSKKVAFAINAASGNRPVLVLANLSGFDGSPESLRKLQLEMGAEIGRAVVNFEGPIVFVVIGRYHGGAYVVFSKALNPNMTALALEGTYASVIGGAPAAAVVFPHEVRKRSESDERVISARKLLQQAPEERKPRLREELDRVIEEVLLEKQGDVAREFDQIHSVERAVRVGSLDQVIQPAQLRPSVISILSQALTQKDEA
ncbi:MAG: hypothetical protein H6728_14950 [Myxococcales bacterium]|nr:hypothetical protein [Myxococcales bacterium]